MSFWIINFYWQFYWELYQCLKFLFYFQSVGLLLAVLESQQEVRAILLPPLLKLGLSSLLVKLLAFEVSELKGERIPKRYSFFCLPVVFFFPPPSPTWCSEIMWKQLTYFGICHAIGWSRSYTHIFGHVTIVLGPMIYVNIIWWQKYCRIFLQLFVLNMYS